ncbi:MAG: hypothetical protein IKU72_02575 [Oscillospiraceae bacterium]|nr:hypothetical protein [Oscillospiraceae bacterium]
MQKHTRKRIAYYQEALPGLKSKIAGAGLMLAIAVIISVMTTYAWVTLSIAPVVSSVNTTVSSNGTLEIALAPNDGALPQEFDVDESGIASTDVTVSNLQWGNLINLSDASYGLDKLVLRPAELSNKLDTKPLKGAVYGSDGRIETTSDNFAYAKWDAGKSAFITPAAGTNDYGVRAIGTYKMVVTGEEQLERQQRASVVENAHNRVNTAYSKVPGGLSNINSLLTTYVEGMVGDEKVFSATQIESAAKLYGILLEAMERHLVAQVEHANFQNYVAGKGDVVLTAQDLENNPRLYDAATADGTSAVKLTGLTTFISDLKTTRQDEQLLKDYAAAIRRKEIDVTWSKIYEKGTTTAAAGYPRKLATIVAAMLDYNTMLVTLEDGKTTVSFQELENNTSGHLQDLLGVNDKGYTDIIIQNGIMKRFEEFAVDDSYRLQGDKPSDERYHAVVHLKGKVTYIVSVDLNIKGYAYTTASGDCYFTQDFTVSKGAEQVPTNSALEDTYGMAVDFWLRTNAEETYLTLEGATTANEKGDIISYDGVNRVWGSTGESLTTTNSTTQGSGSCYIYYVDTPEDYARSLDLLRSLKVAFVGEDGQRLGIASMDTNNDYPVNGRVTVPMVLDDCETTYTYTDDLGEEVTALAISQMNYDQATRITAIVYLDGVNLSNTNVLSASDIEGQLNIQFGSSEDLSTLGDSKLEAEERYVTVKSITPNVMDFKDSDRTATITVEVKGDEPQNMSAFFLRAINATQGERQDPMTFYNQGEGIWVAQYEFTAPGTYYLRHIRMDGVDYAVNVQEGDEAPKVVVEGFDIADIESESFGLNKEITVYSPDNFFEEDIAVTFGSTSADDMPTALTARYEREDGNTVSVQMTADNRGVWHGTGIFQTSGSYTLKNLYMKVGNKNISVAVPEEYMYKLNLFIGLRVEVFNEGGAETEEYDKNVDVYPRDVSVKILDNASNELGELQNAVLKFSRNGSRADTVDTNLVWNVSEGVYKGSLAITSPGSYSFLSVSFEGAEGSLTKAAGAPPTYVILNPDPPSYVYSTAANPVQYELLLSKNDDVTSAEIGPIVIENAGIGKTVKLHNSISGDDYTITNSAAATNIYEKGDNQWYVSIPKYPVTEGNTTTYSMEGVWSVVEITQWDCYNQDGQYCDIENPIVWSATDRAYNFGGLDTDVRCAVNVEMVDPGDTTLGSADAEFMADNYVKDIGMQVQITDRAGDNIPASAFSATGGVEMAVRYSGNTDSKYGYTVTGATSPDAVSFEQQENGLWQVGADCTDSWQYVGEYTVTGLTIKTKTSRTETILPGTESGIPAMYTVTSAAPKAENLLVKVVSQNPTVFGKNTLTGEVTGAFLDLISPNVVVDMQLQYTDNAGKTKVADKAQLSGLNAYVEATYVENSNSGNKYASYTISGTSAHKTLTVANGTALTMSNQTGGNRYTSGSSAMLPGQYNLALNVQVNGEKCTNIDYSSVSSNGQLKPIEIYAKLPTLTVTGTDRAKGEEFETNLVARDANNAWNPNNGIWATVQNYHDTYSANIYIEARKITDGYPGEIVAYTLPKVELTLSDFGSGMSTATAVISGNADGTAYTNQFAFTPSSPSYSAAIGYLGKGSFTYEVKDDSLLGGILGSTETKTQEYDTKYWIGEQSISSVQIIASGDSAVFTLNVTQPITIREVNEAMPTITYDYVDGYNTPEAVTSPNGGSFMVTLPASIGTVNKEYKETDENIPWTTSDNVKGVANFVNYTNTSNPEQKNGCNGMTYGAQADFVYHLYERTETTKTKVSPTNYYLADHGLVAWLINGVEYAPGAEYEVTGTVTAIPVIGVLGSADDWTLTKTETATIKEVWVIDVDLGTQSVEKVTTPTSDYSSPTAADEALYTEENYIDYIPSGYEFIDATNITGGKVYLVSTQIF